MHGLKPPTRSPGFGIQRDDTARPDIVEWPSLRANIVEHGAAERGINQTEALIGAHELGVDGV